MGETVNLSAAQAVVEAARVKADETNHFLFFPAIQGLDGAKVKAVADKGAAIKEELAVKGAAAPEGLKKLNAWYETVEMPHVESDQKPVGEANIYGGKRALQITAGVPVAMAIGYLLIVFYFIAKGGYKAVHLDASGREIEVDHKATPEENMVGGTVGPMEA